MESVWKEVESEEGPSEGVISQKRIKTLYKISLGVSGFMLFFVGWGMWNIPLESSEGIDGPFGEVLGWLFFSGGLFVQLILSPILVWFALPRGDRRNE
jgi:hypothetical protein